ncbi:MAG: hypothetical protein DCC67_15530 [Planctomycetota bacterium]|nr:MAG: hypothetical protein DCC67_15530 [Planctomycetota bacterium]
MGLSFVQDIEALARRLRRRRRAAACCWVIAGTAAAALALIVVDWRLGVYERWSRLLLTAALLAAAAALWRWRRPGPAPSETALGAALDLERRYPEHRSLLASGVEFSSQPDGDPAAGSADLRRAAILQAAAVADSIDFAAVVPRAPLRRAVAALATVGAMLAAFAVTSPEGLATGLLRLGNPWCERQYPHRHQLAFASLPTVAPAGGDFVAALVDRRGELPPTVEVQFRTRRQGRLQYDRQTYTTAGTRELKVRRGNVQEPFEIRAVGGDHHTMPWRRVRVAPAPRLESLAVTVIPPQYAGQSAFPATDPVQMLAGSRLQVRGRVDAPVSAAALLREGEPPVPLAVGESGRTFDTPPEGWMPATSGQWAIVLTTPRGMRAAAERRLRVEVLNDDPPTVELLQPTEDLAVLPEAVVDLSLQARDDVAVQSLRLVLEPDSTAAAPQVGTRQINVVVQRGLETPGPAAADYSLAIAEYALPVGSTWSAYAQAEDSRGQTGSSTRRLTLRVITPEELLRQTNQRLNHVSDLLQQALAEQRAVAERVSQWQTHAVERPSAEEVESLVQRQRQVREAIAGEGGSAARLAEQAREVYERNRWPDVHQTARIQQLTQTLEQLDRTELGAIETRLSAFVRWMPQTAPGGSLTAADKQSLAVVHAAQAEVQRVLADALKDLESWSELRQFQQAVARLQRQQDALAARTAEMARAAWGPPGDAAQGELARQASEAADQQRELAARLGQSLHRAEQAAARLADERSPDAAPLRAAVQAAEQGRAEALTRAAAEQLASRQFGQAAAAQRSASEQLQRVLNETQTDAAPTAALDRVLKELVAEQGGVVREVERLGRPTEAGASPSGEIRQRLTAVRNRQSDVALRLGVLARSITAYPVFVQSLRAIGDTMAGAVRELEAEPVGQDTAVLTRRAYDELRQLSEAVHQHRQGSTASSGRQPGDRPAPPRATPQQVQQLRMTLAQLSLLRTRQRQLQDQATALERAWAAGSISQSQRARQSTELADQQRELAVMAEKLTAAANLPELGEAGAAE